MTTKLSPVYPEIADGREGDPYRIEATKPDGMEAAIDKANRILRLPAQSEAMEAFIRHELAHGKLSPVKPPKAWRASLRETTQAIEDARVQLALRSAGLECEFRALEPRMLEALKRFAYTGGDQLPRLTLSALSTIGSDCETSTENALREICEALGEPELFKIYRTSARKLRALQKEAESESLGAFTFEQGQRIARATERALLEYWRRKQEDSQPEGESQKGSGSDSGKGDDAGAEKSDGQGDGNSRIDRREYSGKRGPREDIAGAGWSSDESEENVSLSDRTQQAEARREALKRGEIPSERDSGMQPMYSVRVAMPSLPMPVRCAHRWGDREKRQCETGMSIRRPLRWYTDRRIFGRKIRTHLGGGGGSVLADLSGSMDLDVKDVLRLIRACPHDTTVAGYAGTNCESRKPGDEMGALAIYARRGWRVADSCDLSHAHPLMRGSNAIDIEALEWLAAQRGPRLWISDGAITRPSTDGRKVSSEDLCDYSARRCLRIMRENDIYRVESVDDAVAILNGEKALSKCGVQSLHKHYSRRGIE